MSHHGSGRYKMSMSFFGGGIEASLASLAQVQRAVAEGKDRERASSASARRVADSVRLRVGGIEHPDAIRKSENDDLEERESRDDRSPDDQRRDPGDLRDVRPNIDLTA